MPTCKIFIFWRNWPVLRTLGVCALAGVAVYLIGHAI